MRRLLPLSATETRRLWPLGGQKKRAELNGI
jgi:hypothetical protein